MKVTLLTQARKLKDTAVFEQTNSQLHYSDHFKIRRFLWHITLLVCLSMSGWLLQAQPSCPIDAGTNGPSLQFGLANQADCAFFQNELVEVAHPGGIGTYIILQCNPFGQGTFLFGTPLPANTPLSGMLNFGALGLACQYSNGILVEGGITVECNCLDNESPDGPAGQFTSQFVVSSAAGETWEVINGVNIYDYIIVNPAPPFPFTNAIVPEQFVNANVSNYIFNFLHLDGENYSFRIQNQANPAIGFDVVGPTAGCAYPNLEIDGDPFVCSEASEIYSVADITQASYQWSLSGGGVIVGPTDDYFVQVDWEEQEGGPYTLEVVVNTIHGCEETASLDVEIEGIIALACNNNVNLSMDLNCEVQVTPDMVLEDPQFEDDSYTIQLWDIAADTLVPNGIINGIYVGTILEVQVTQICGENSCWGYITVEDKTVPDLECEDVTIHCSEDTSPFNTGLPIPDDAEAIYNGDGTWTVLGFDACGESILSYYDDVTNLNCVGPFAAVIIRNWKLTDGSGSMSTCQQNIYTELAVLGELELPPNYDGTQEDHLLCQDINDTWIPLPEGHPFAGHPSPESTGSPQGPTCLNLVVDFTDQHINKCGPNAFTVIRKWTIWDICNNDYREHNQTIKVLDEEGPICVAPNEFDVYTIPGECSVNIDVPAPIVIFDCSGWSYTVKYKLRDESGNPFLFPIDDNVVYTGGGYTIVDIPFDTDSVWIVYLLEDDCGNKTQCFTEAALHDVEEPVAVCDQHTTVSVGEDGMGWANVWAFDDGSWDNCEIDYMEARRMEDFSCGIVNGWTQTVKFCCEDIGEAVMVQLRVFDIYGNSNSCMVEVYVQDNFPPRLVSCPADVTVDCGTDLSGDLSEYGTPDFDDNCDVDIDEEVVRSINDCGIGEVIRYFTGTDPSGNPAYCSQTIYVRELDPFYINRFNPNDINDDVDWPGDIIVEGCIDPDTDPEDLPNGYDEPEIFETPCSMVAFNYEDLVFQIVDDACFKILRKWTVIDWCQYDQFNPGAGGIWYYTQVIKVQNSSAPDFAGGCEDVTITGTPVNGCQAYIELTAWANDDCTGELDLVWYYEIDLYNDGSIDHTGHSPNASGTYPFGIHKVFWSVTDQCGNQTTCMQFVTITDTKPPTPICIGELVTVVMQNNGSVTVWAVDFLKQALDNCSAPEDIDVSFSASVNDKYRTFDCADLEDGVSETFELQIWLTDEAGNQDFCTVELIVQDNSNTCPDPGASEFAEVSGAIYTEMEQMIDAVEVSLNADMAEFPISDMSEEGYFAFSNLLMYQDYSIEPWKDDQHLAGVSTLDLVLIQKHILGITLLNSPYKIIAADANNSETVSATDLVQLRKLILGLIDELPENNAWRFVDADFDFEDPHSPFPFVESIILDQLDHNVNAADFIAVKIGDVNDSVYEFGESSVDVRDRQNTGLYINDKTFTKGEPVKLRLQIPEASNVLGMQFTLEFDPSSLQFENMEAEGLNIGDEHVGLQDLGVGLIHISVSDAYAHFLDKNSGLFRLVFTARESGMISNTLEVNSSLISPEIYISEGGNVAARSLDIEFRDDQGLLVGDDKFILYQNVPNPFSSQTTIGFNLPEAGNAQLKMFDVNGRLIKEIIGVYPKGYNELRFDFDDINYTGILYYQLETQTHSANKKMIVIK